MRGLPLYSLILVLLFGACERWNTTDEVSHVSELPRITLAGETFMSVLRNDTLEYEEPGASAVANGQELTVYASGSVDLSQVGVYLILYSAFNHDGLENTVRRIIAVTSEPVSGNDLSGTYEGTLWTPMEMEVKQLHRDGWYQCEEVLGHPLYEIPGQFVDLGNNQLVLLPGDGDLGSYAASEGEYSLSTLNWVVHLLDKPNDGIEIAVLWRKKF